MKFNKIHMKNYKRFKDTTVTFSDDLYLITGANGIGKTSLFGAIDFALFGVSSGLSPDFIVSSYADSNAKCEVELDFTFGGINYNIFRAFRKGKTTSHDAILTRDGKQYANGVTQVKAEVARIIGMGPRDAHTTFFAQQKDLTALTDLSTSERKEWLLRAFGLDYLNVDSQKILKERVDAADKNCALIQGELTALNRTDLSELNRLQDSLAVMQTQINELAIRKEAVATEHARLMLDKHAMDESDMRYRGLLEKSRILNADIVALTTKLNILAKQANAIACDPEELNRLSMLISAIPEVKATLELFAADKIKSDVVASKCKVVENTVAMHNANIEKLNKKISDVAACNQERIALMGSVMDALGIQTPKIGSVGDLETTISTLNTEAATTISLCNANMRRNSDMHATLLQKRGEIEKAGADGDCPLCMQKLGGKLQDVLDDYDARIATLIAEQGDITACLKAATDMSTKMASVKKDVAGIRELNNIAERFGDTKIELGGVMDLRDKATASLNSLRTEMLDIKYDSVSHAAALKRMSDLESNQSLYTRMLVDNEKKNGIDNQIADVKKQIESKNTELLGVTESIKCVAFNPELKSKLDAAIASNDSESRFVGESIATLTAQQISSLDSINRLHAVSERIVKLKSQHSELLSSIETLKLTRSLISNYVLYLMGVVRGMIEESASNTLSVITDGKYNRIVIDDNFNIMIAEGDGMFLVDRYSGGEQDVIAISLRLALSKILPAVRNVHEVLPFMVDEGFSSLDEERQGNLMKVFRKMVEGGGQIMAITHLDLQGEHMIRVVGNGNYSDVEMV